MAWFKRSSYNFNYYNSDVYFKYTYNKIHITHIIHIYSRHSVTKISDRSSCIKITQINIIRYTPCMHATISCNKYLKSLRWLGAFMTQSCMETSTCKMLKHECYKPNIDFKSMIILRDFRSCFETYHLNKHT